MVCNRCIMVVKSELERYGFNPVSVKLGEAEMDKELTEKEIGSFEEGLHKYGFELIGDKKSRWIEKIKTCIVNLVYNRKEPVKVNLSSYISDELHHDYSYLSNLFSEVQGITIEQYFIAQKIERVKELLVYDELTLGEIAHQLNYSSVSHLSKQFKKVTGLTPTHFKKVKENRRTPIDDL